MKTMTQKTAIEDYLMASESKSVKVLLWILKNRDKNNQIHTTLTEVAKECEVTRVTVNTVFQRLYKKGLMKKVHNGQYQLVNV